MTFTVFSFFMSLLWCHVFILMCLYLRHQTKFVQTYGMGLLLTLMTVAALRLVVPVELPFSIVIPSYRLLPATQHFLIQELFTLGAVTIRHYHLWLFVWVFVAVLLLVGLAVRMYQERIFLHSLHTLDNRQECMIMNQIMINRGFERKCGVIVSNEVKMPLLVGYFSPTIFLPDLMWSNEELESVLNHELTHFIHRDIWKRLAMHLLCIFFWWNPLVYMVKGDFDDALELQCDSAVAKKLDYSQRRSYVNAVGKVIKDILYSPPMSGPTTVAFASANEDMLLTRCEFILRPPRRLSKSVQVGLHTVLLALLILSYTFVFQPRTEAPVYDHAVEMTADDSYLVLTQSGKYDVYLNGVFSGTISAEGLVEPPFSTIPILEGSATQ